MLWYSASASRPSCGPASQVLSVGPIEVLETSTVRPSRTRNHPPPEEPPVIVQPIRYIVGRVVAREHRPGASRHLNIPRPLEGGAAGEPPAPMLPAAAADGAEKSTSRAAPTVSSRDLPPCSGCTCSTA